jgi:glycosyltransferase involved in cell wall biosynthesis
MPLALIEAMAAGVPQVATDVCGNREVIDPDETGILVEPASGEALADAIIELLEDDELRREFAENSLIRSRQLFGIDKMVDATMEAYGCVLDRVNK